MTLGVRMKQNCWEYMGCGRQPGGTLARQRGICRAAEERRLDGIHGGRRAGRACWVVAGTLCDDEVQGVFASKYGQCEKCDFYKLVKREEYPNFKLASVLLRRLR